jgi:hypothetical protein
MACAWRVHGVRVAPCVRDHTHTPLLPHVARLSQDLDAFLDNYIQQLHEGNGAPVSGQGEGSAAAGMAQFGATQFAPGPSSGPLPGPTQQLGGFGGPGLGTAAAPGMGFPTAQGGLGMGMAQMGMAQPGGSGSGMGGMEFSGGIGIGGGIGGMGGGNMDLSDLPSMDINELLQQVSQHAAMAGGGASGGGASGGGPSGSGAQGGSQPTGSGASGSAPKVAKGKAKGGRPASAKAAAAAAKDDEEVR